MNDLRFHPGVLAVWVLLLGACGPGGDDPQPRPVVVSDAGLPPAPGADAAPAPSPQDAASRRDSSSRRDLGAAMESGSTPAPAADAAASPPPPSPTTDAGPSSPGSCAVTRPGATGSEKDGLIPVCCTPSSSEKAFIDEVFRLLNEHRAKNGAPALSYDDKLEQAIQGHCQHMAAHSFFDHGAPEAAVASFSTRAKLCGGSAFGENIAYNQVDPAAVMRTWIGSSGHNENMLNASYRRVGICFHQRRWGQIFGR